VGGRKGSPKNKKNLINYTQVLLISSLGFGGVIEQTVCGADEGIRWDLWDEGSLVADGALLDFFGGSGSSGQSSPVQPAQGKPGQSSPQAARGDVPSGYHSTLYSHRSRRIRLVFFLLFIFHFFRFS